MRLEGRLIGKAAFDTLKTIRTKFNSGDLIPFSSDIWAIEDITTVIFEGFSVGVHDGIQLEISYTMLLREAKPPPEEGAGEKGAPSQKGEAEKEVEEKTKEITKEKEGGKEEGKGEEKGEGKEEGKAEKPKEKEGAPEGKGELDKDSRRGRLYSRLQGRDNRIQAASMESHDLLQNKGRCAEEGAQAHFQVLHRHQGGR